MAKVWTSERDQRLFLLFIEQVKVDAPALVAAWKTNYVDTGVDDFTPTSRAIQEHIKGLKASAGIKGAKKATATPKATPKKSTVTKTPSKTPTSGVKRKRNNKKDSSDEDEEPMEAEDSNDEREALNHTPSTSRHAYSRRSKSVAKSYRAEDSEEDADGEEDAAAEEEDGGVPVAAPDAGDEDEDHHIGTMFDGGDDSIEVGQGVEKMDLVTPQRKGAGGVKGSAFKRIKREVRGDESDGSEFTPDV